LNLPEVRVGQIWKDNDKRRAEERFVRVMEVAGGKVRCERVVKLAADALLGAGEWTPAGRITNISLGRFVPNATGYALVEDHA
jgi:hypothetical protein